MSHRPNTSDVLKGARGSHEIGDLLRRLEALLAQLDNLGLNRPAISVSEAIFFLEHPM